MVGVDIYSILGVTSINTISKIAFSGLAILFCFAVADTAGAVAGSLVFVWLIWCGFEMGAKS